MSKRIAAIRVDYITNPVIDAARYEPEAALYWVARLIEYRPSTDYTAKCNRIGYVDDNGRPLFFVCIVHIPSKKTLYVRSCELIEVKF